MDLLFARLNAIALMSPALNEHLRKILKRKVLKKKQIIHEPGQICRMVWFIESGMVRQYSVIYTLKELKEVVFWILLENDIVTEIKSFLNQVPGTQYIQATERSVVWYITYDELVETLKLFPEFQAHFSFILAKYYTGNIEREERNGNGDCCSRVKWLLVNRPEWIGRAPQPTIASYLGMTYKTYNKWRNR